MGFGAKSKPVKSTGVVVEDVKPENYHSEAKQRQRLEYFENRFVGKKFDLTLRTEELEKNLDNYSSRPSMFNAEQAKYTSGRFQAKADIIRKAYADGMYEGLARKFEETSKSLASYAESRLASNHTSSLSYV